MVLNISVTLKEFYTVEWEHMNINRGLPRIWMEEIPEYFQLSSGNCLELITKTHKIPELSVANNPNENRIRTFRKLLCDKMALYIRDF
jgi:hypothetical protein